MLGLNSILKLCLSQYNVFHHHLGHTITSVKNAQRYQLMFLYRYYRYRNYLKKYTKYSHLTQKTPLQLLNTFAYYAQSLYNFHSVVELVELCLNHPYYKPSSMAGPSQTVQELLDQLPPHTLVCHLSRYASSYALFAQLLLLIAL